MEVLPGLYPAVIVNVPDRPFKRPNTHSMISILALHKENCEINKESL